VASRKKKTSTTHATQQASSDPTNALFQELMEVVFDLAMTDPEDTAEVKVHLSRLRKVVKELRRALKGAQG